MRVQHLLYLFLGCALLMPLHAAAEGLQFKNDPTYHLLEGAIEPHELWLLSEDVLIEGKVLQDLIAACNTADVSGQFLRSLWMTGEKLTMNGDVAESARLFARNTAVLGGRVGNNLMAAAVSTLKIEPTAHIENDAILAAHDVMQQGVIDGRMVVWANRVTLGGEVKKSVHLRAEDIVVLPGTRIGGDLIYTAPKELVLDRSVQLAGTLIRRDLAPTSMSLPQLLTIQIFLLVAAFLTGLALVPLFPRLVGASVRRVRFEPWKSTLVGGVALFLIPSVAMVALLSGVGIPLSLILMALYGTLLYMAKIIVALTLGGLLLVRREPLRLIQRIMTLLSGLFTLYVMTNIPVFGGVALTAILLLGLGGLILGGMDVQYTVQKQDLKPVENQPPTEPDVWRREP